MEQDAGYIDFLASKQFVVKSHGVIVGDDEINPILFPFQRDMVRWALRKGVAAIFADTGLGKTFMQLEWSRLTGERTLIISPLSVAKQTIKEALKLGITVTPCRSMADVRDGINITNYEMVDHFDPEAFGAVVLDESGILKGLDSKTKQLLTEMFIETPYKLCCTATPAPNDITEIANHAEFLGIMSRANMLAAFFVHDDEGWRLKGHAEKAFYKWMASWGMSLKKPSDLGYSDEGFILPKLTIIPEIIEAEYQGEDRLFWTGLKGITDRIAVRKSTLELRVKRAAELIRQPGQWLCWVGMNEEGRLLQKLVPEAALMEGGDKPEKKLADIEGFQDGSIRVLISKSRIAGFGLNFQNCHQMAFVGLGDSFESYYQCIRRCYRFGQTKPVQAHIVITDMEEAIYQNVISKEEEAKKMGQNLIENIKEFEQAEIGEIKQEFTYATDTVTEPDFTCMLGDSVERIQEIPSDSVGLSVFSPPFISLYTYSPTERDIGNCKDDDEFYHHFGFIIRELLRITKPGRNACVHVSQVPAMLSRDGFIGLKDFRGGVIRHFIENGWVYHGEVCIDKDPQPLKDGTNVLTPFGYVPIENVHVGDLVIGKDGKTVPVIAKPFHGEQPLYRIAFNDGATIDCGPTHLWTVRTSKENAWQVKTTQELLDGGVLSPSGKFRWEVPIISPVEYGEKKLPVHPKLLGALLADGHLGDRVIEITKDHELIKALPLPDNHKLVMRKDSDRADGRTATYAITCDTWHVNDVLSGIRNLGLEDKTAAEKFIPEIYLRGSIDQRKELLTGLLDGDGKIRPNGAIYYLTISEELAHSVVELVNSLGGLAHMRCGLGSKYGDGKQGQPLYTISIRLTGDWCPLTLQRKAQYWKNNRRGIVRKIVSIKPLNKSAMCTCISVGSADGLFATEGHVLTHNSQAIRTHSKALLFAQLRKDSSWSRPALADYILIFRKPGDNPETINPDITNDEWIEWARPIWYGIRETDTLNFTEARENADERHICPLQLGTIERCVKLWSNPGDIVLDPFGGIGSTGHVAVKAGRRFHGIELKQAYYRVMVKNLYKAKQSMEVTDLFNQERSE